MVGASVGVQVHVYVRIRTTHSDRIDVAAPALNRWRKGIAVSVLAFVRNRHAHQTAASFEGNGRWTISRSLSAIRLEDGPLGVSIRSRPSTMPHLVSTAQLNTTRNVQGAGQPILSGWHVNDSTASGSCSGQSILNRH